jgi:hypothetical protein
MNILSCVLVTEMGFRLVIGFINRLQLVITNNYNTVPDFYSTNPPRQSSESIPTCLHYPFPGNGSQHRNDQTHTSNITHKSSLHRSILHNSSRELN